jgi:hypothetical protein
MNIWSGPRCRATTGRVCGPRKTMRACVDWSSDTRTAEPSRNQLRLQLAVAGKRLRCSLSDGTSTRRTRKPRTHASNVVRGSNLRQKAALSDFDVAIVLSTCCVISDYGPSSRTWGDDVSSVHQLNSPGNGHHADPRGCTIDVAREPYGAQQGCGSRLFGRNRPAREHDRTRAVFHIYYDVQW